MARLPTFAIDQPVLLTTAQLRTAINESIFEGGCTITIGEPNAGKKKITIAWGDEGKTRMSVDAPEDFEILPEKP